MNTKKLWFCYIIVLLAHSYNALYSFPLHTVAITGELALGTVDGTFEFPSPSIPLRNFAPIINARGDVAFQATISQFGRSGTGIWIEEDGVLRSVVQLGDVENTTGKEFSRLSIPRLAENGDLIIGVQVARNNALLRETPAGLQIVASEGERFSNFTDVVVNNNDIAFLGRVPNRLPSQQRLYRTVDSDILGIATTDRPAPILGSPFVLNSISLVHMNEFGQVAFRGALSRSSIVQNSIIYAGEPGSLRIVARRGDIIPYGAGEIILSNPYDFSLSASGEVSFISTIDSGDYFNPKRAFVAEVDGQRRVVALQGEPAPGLHEGVYFGSLFLDELRNENNDFVFTAYIDGDDVTEDDNIALWTGPWDDLQLVARKGDPAPGIPGMELDRITSTTSKLSLNARGQVALLSTFTGDGVQSGMNLGLWATDAAGNLQLIARQGGELEIAPGVFKTIRDLAFLNGSNGEDGSLTGLNDLGQVAFAATFTDLTYGVFVSNAVAIPEPATGLLLMIATLVTTWRR